MIQKAICIGKQDLDMQELYIYMTRSHMIWLKKKVGPGQCQSYHSYQDTVKLSNFTKLHQQVYPEFLAGNRVI